MLRIGVIYTVLMAAALLVFLHQYDKNRMQERDIAYYNDCLIRMYEDYGKGVAEESLEETYGCQIVFSKELVQTEMAAYYKSGALVLDFSPGGEYLGKVVWDDMREGSAELKGQLRKTAMIFWAGVLIAGYLLLAFLWVTLLKPVAELSAYSAQIAKGNLDVPLPMRKKSLFGSFIASFDIMREELKQSRQREVEAGIAKKEMIAALSHDIKTPVATIRATCEVLEAKYQRKLADMNNGTEAENETDIRDTLEKASSIMAKAQLIDSLMNNLLHTSLEELDRIEVEPNENPSELIEQYVKNMKDAGDGHLVILDNEIPRCLVYMDKLRMEQVIDNCVGNSVKYAGTDIHVSFDEVSGNYIRIRISDAGPGVAEADLPLICEKYYRGKGANEKNGYGLGMYLVKLYMEKQGGGLEYYNDNGFTVELLLRKV